MPRRNGPWDSGNRRSCSSRIVTAATPGAAGGMRAPPASPFASPSSTSPRSAIPGSASPHSALRTLQTRRQSRSSRITTAAASNAPGGASASPASAPAAPRPGASGGGEALISGEGLAKSFGMDVLFEGLDVTISRGQKLGLLGRNGCGKSTLLRILAGMDAPDKGKVQRRRHLNLAFLAQDPDLPASLSLLDADPDLPASLSLLDAVLSADNAAMRAVREYERAAQRMKGRGACVNTVCGCGATCKGDESRGEGKGHWLAGLSSDNAAMRAVREYKRAAQRMKGRDPTPLQRQQRCSEPWMGWRRWGHGTWWQRRGRGLLIIQPPSPTLSTLPLKTPNPKPPDPTPSEAAALQRAMDGVEAMGAWDVVAEAEKLLEILGLGDAALTNGGGGGGGGIMERQVSSLSGGQKKRVALAATLLAKPELIILDEPTNHMDVAVIDWMQSALSDPSLTVVLVSHDRYFLDAVCTQMLEIDRGTSFRHSGNYTNFLAARAKRAVEEAAAIGRAANTLRREGEWMRRMPKARSTKSRSRIDRFLALTKATAEKRQRQQQAAVGSVVEMGMGEARLGGKVLELRDATAMRGESTVFEGFTYEFGRGDRLGVVGRNGAGKTTFLDALAGLLPLPSGTRDVGETVVMGYYTQHMPPVPDNMRVLDFVQNFNPTAAVLGSWGSIPAAAAAAAAGDGSASSSSPVAAGSGGASMSGGSGSDEPVSASELLERFGFPRAKQYAWASKLSGGEKRRLLLAAVLAQRPNFLMLDEPTNDLDLQTIERPNCLMLDEPTNDLDLQTIEALESFLSAYEGCLLVASHDRAFMDAVVDRQFVLQGDGQVLLYDGLFSEYLADAQEQKAEMEKEEKERVAEEERRKEAEAKSVAEERRKGEEGAGSGGIKVKGKSARKMSYMERKEWERLEKEIEKLEKKKVAVEAQLEEKSKAGDFAMLQGLSDELAALGQAIEAKSDRWLELAELAE
ncbi:unnamed protein product [Closterium sp. NIES-65]|nr:unnamed protein product [Closterium sp. NIES-65]